MSVTVREAERIAGLARLSFPPEDMRKLAVQLNDILHHMEQLNKLDTSNVEPLIHVREAANVLREDVVTPCVDRTDALKNAPAKSDEFFKVPKVIKER